MTEARWRAQPTEAAAAPDLAAVPDLVLGADLPREAKAPAERPRQQAEPCPAGEEVRRRGLVAARPNLPVKEWEVAARLNLLAKELVAAER